MITTRPLNTCMYCMNSGKAGMRVEGRFVCDDCLNRPERTRPWLFGKKEAAALPVSTDAAPAEGTPVVGPRPVLNRLEIRDDDETGPLVLPPKDGDLHDISEAEIEKARAEQAADPRKFTPTDERTLKRIGAQMVGAEIATEGPKPSSEGSAEAAGAVVKGAGKAARNTARPKARKPERGRSHKAR